MRESRRGRIFVRGLARHAVGNVRQGLELAQMAKTKRHTASNNINATSSRSHSICQLEIAYGPPSFGKRTGPRDSDLDSECETDDDSSYKHWHDHDNDLDHHNNRGNHHA